MALSVNEIVETAAGILQDVGSVRYSAADLVDYINLGQRRVCQMKPEAYCETLSTTLVNGPKQNIPLSATRLLDVYRNAKDDGTPGRSVRLIDRAVLDREDPDWHRRTGSQVEHYCYEPENDPQTYWVFPVISPNRIGSARLDISIAKDPTDVVPGGYPVIDQVYHEALIHYVVATAISRDAEFGDQMNRAQFHAQAFATGIGVRNPKNVAL